MNSSRLITRVKSILLTPKTEWPVIASEPDSSMGIYTGYILLLAALPALCQFLKLAVFGYSVPFLGTMHVGTGFALEMALRIYLGSIIGCFVVALIVNALAPTFGGQKDSVQALKVVAYSYTSSWIAGIAVLLPVLGTADHVRGPDLRHLSAVSGPATDDEVSAREGGRVHRGHTDLRDHHRRAAVLRAGHGDGPAIAARRVGDELRSQPRHLRSEQPGRQA